MAVSDPENAAEPLPLACVITELDPGGAERAFVRVVIGLKVRGWSPHVVSLVRTDGDGPLRESLVSGGLPVTALGRLKSNPVAFLRHLRRVKPAACLSFLFHANLLTRMTAKLAGSPPVVCGVRVAERRRNGHRTLDRLTGRLVDRWVCVGESVRRFSVAPPSAGGAGLPADRVLAIPNGVDGDRWATAEPADRASLGLPPDGPVLLFAGRLSAQKDPDTLLAGYAALAATHPDASLLIAGDGPDRARMTRWCETHAAGPRVRLPGRRDDLPNLMRLADLFVLPSRWEGTPNVLLEAAAAGTPVVATAVDGTAEVFAHGETARLVPAGDAAALAAELAWVLDRPAEANEMAGRARTHVLARHDWAAVCDAYDRVLREVVERRRARGRQPPVQANAGDHTGG